MKVLIFYFDQTVWSLYLLRGNGALWYVCSNLLEQGRMHNWGLKNECSGHLNYVCLLVRLRSVCVIDVLCLLSSFQVKHLLQAEFLQKLQD